MTPQTAALVRISGRVQGVAFRAWTEGRARQLGLEGWVKNEPDGSVLALIGGPQAQVQAMIEAFHSGPPWAEVRKVELAPADPGDVPPGFEIIR
ncbi:MAG TPA: acylphosphatase [Rhodobacterales bacterium]|nr:acylphosphatase [Rhodobacterales bacterium]